MTGPVRVLEKLPASADANIHHLVHKLKGSRGLALGMTEHPAYKGGAVRVSIGKWVILMQPDWLEPDLPRGGYF